MALDPWGPILGRLFEDKSSEYILGVLQRAGVPTSFNLTDEEAYSHNTRKRAYLKRLDPIYSQLAPGEQHRVAQNLVHEIAKSEHGLENLNVALDRVGWIFQNDELTPLLQDESDLSAVRLPSRSSPARLPVSERPPPVPRPIKTMNKKIFIGHGRSLVWHQLKDFLTDRLHLSCDEFNSEAVAGKTTTARLQELLNNAGFAFLVMTAEDTHSDNSAHARENVIHEAGLFQGHLGFERAIILLEDGCTQFSNIHGLSHIPFQKGNMATAFEAIRLVLEREKFVQPLRSQGS